MTSRFGPRIAAGLALALAAVVVPVVGGREAPSPRTWTLAASPGVLEAPGPFAMVGVAWPATSRPAHAVEVKTSADGVRWTAWTPLGDADEEGPDLTAPERTAAHATQPLWVGDARFVRVRFAGARPAGARLRVVDPGPDPSSLLPSAAAAPGQPAVVSRRSWGADESIRRCCTRYAPTVKVAYIHHTATSNSYTSSDGPRLMRSIYAYHVKTNGWDDIGYNFVVDKYGKVYEGRAGGIDKAVIGAHAGGFNTGSTGIAVLGTYGGGAPSSAAASSLKKLLAWKLNKTFVDPAGTTTLTSGGNSKYAAGRVVNVRTIAGHRDTSDTDCPGDALYRTISSLRTAVRPMGDPKIFNPLMTRGAFTPNSDGYSDGTRFRARFSSSVRWTLQITDSAGAVLRTFSGSGSSVDQVWYGNDANAKLLPHGDYRFRLSGASSKGSTGTAQVNVKLWRPPNGTLFTAAPSGASYVLEAGRLRELVAPQALASRYRTSEAVKTGDAVTTLYPSGADLGFRDGSVVRVGSAYWVISDGLRRSASAGTLAALGYAPGAAVAAPSSALTPHAVGPPLTAASGRPDGTAVYGSGREGRMVDGVARPFLTTRIRTSWAIRDAELAGPADGEMLTGALTPPLGFRDGTLLKTASSPVYVISDGRRRPISSGTRFRSLGYSQSNVITVTEAELALHPEGAAI